MSYNYSHMKYTLLLLTLILTTAQANLGSYKNGKFIFPNTNKPYTGNLETINNDWGKDAVCSGLTNLDTKIALYPSRGY